MPRPLPETALLAEVARLLEAVTGIPASQVGPERSFVDDLCVDSLAMVEVLTGCEQRLGIAVADEATVQLVYVGDLVAYLRDHQRVEQGPPSR